MSAEIRQYIQQLGSPLVERRNEAQAALIKLGAQAVDELLRTLHHPTRDLRTGAALTLGTLGARQALSPLCELASDEQDASARPLLLRAISDLSSPDADAQVQAFLVRTLGDEDMFCRALACRALGKVASAGARKALELMATADPEQWVRDAARQAMVVASGKHTSPSAEPGVTHALATVDPLAQHAQKLSALDVATQKKAASALIAAGADAVTVVGPLLFGSADSTKRAAAEVLGSIGGERATELLTSMLADDSLSSSLRAVALYAMGSSVALCANPAASCPADLLRAHLGDPDTFVRAAAVSALVRCGAQHRELAVRALLDDEEEWVQETGLRTLAEVATARDRRLRAMLHDGLARVIAPTAQLALLIALLQILDPPTDDDKTLIGPISYFLDNPEPEIRRVALHLTLRISPTIDAPLLARIREEIDDDPSAEAEFAESLRTIANPNRQAAFPLLQSMTDSPDPAVVEDACIALAQLGSLLAIDLLVTLANSGLPIAADALSQLAPDAPLTATQDEAGLWHRQFNPRCTCGSELAWIARGEREELRCPECDEEYLLGAESGRLIPAARSPFGACLCCTRKQPLVRGGASGGALLCPQSEEIHIRPHDNPRHLLRLRDLPFGACSCCEEPQPLVRSPEGVLCRRTRETHVADGNGGYALQTRARAESAASDIDAINEALLGGTLGIGQSGVPVAASDPDAED